MITPFTATHVDAVVDIHLRSFEQFFLTFLGPQFLRLYYEGVVAYPGSVGYVYVDDERVVGFVCGALSPSNFYKLLLRTRWHRFALAAASAALQRPSIIPRLWRAFAYPSQTPSQSDTATLMSIAVDPTYQAKGVGVQLVAAFLEGMRARGVKRVALTTDRCGNDITNAFYQKIGFRCQRTFLTPEGREMNEYVISL